MAVVRVFNATMLLLFGLIWAGACAFLRMKKRKDYVYLTFFTLFFMYLYKVLDYTLFQFQSLLLLRHFLPGLMLKGNTAGKSLNLIPLVTLTALDLKTSLLNILLMIPFGIGLPLLTSLRMKRVVVMGALLSIGIELLQLVTGLVGGITFRVADVNDVIFNTAGAAIGYSLFVGLVRLYRRAYPKSENPFLRYAAGRPQVSEIAK